MDTGVKSPFSPRIKQSTIGKRSLGNISAMKNSNKLEAGEEIKGEIIYKSPQITLETYGPPLPVMVTEALAFANSEVSVKISKCGWCWLVVGRRILTWPLNTPAGAGATNAARELILPQTDLAHKSDLVDIFYEDDEQSPSCIGVSPEGVIRYWPSVRHSGVYSEVSAELGGQECAVLQPSAPLHLLATTTCTLGAVHHESVEGRSSVWYSGLSAGGGWLGSLGRRVSLLFFGATPQQPDIKLSALGVVRAGGVLCEGGSGLVALATGGATPALQLFAAHPLASVLLPQLLARHTQVGPGGCAESVSVLALAVTDAGELALLLALSGRDLRYLLAVINVEEPESPRVSWVCHVNGVRIEARPALLTSGATLVLYTANYIAMTTLYGGGAWACVEWGGGSGGSGGSGGGGSGGGGVAGAAGGGLRGAGVVGGRLVLFDCRHSPIALTHTRSAVDTPLQSPSVTDIYTGNLSLLEIDPYEIARVVVSARGVLKAALLLHVRGDESARDLLLRRAFPHAATAAHTNDWQGSPKAPPSKKAIEVEEVDASLDQTVYKIALEILDDIPTGDPRWQAAGAEAGSPRSEQACSVPLGASCALGAGAQLRDKQLALALFAHMLMHTPLERHLAKVTTDDGRVLDTMAALGELAGRLAAALLLHAQTHPALERAVLQVVSSSLMRESGGVVEAYRAGLLSARDVCFRRASSMPDLLDALAHDTRALPLLASALHETASCRVRWPRAPPPAHSLLRAIVDLLPASVNELKSDAMPVSSKGQTLSALCSLADLLLAETAALKDNPYADKIFDALVEAGEKERALLLAEKYKHFDALVDMCVKHHGLDRLFSYIDKYIDEGIAERALNIVRRVGGHTWARLLQYAASRPRLAASLPCAERPHDDANILVQLSSGQYLAASETLADRAEVETCLNTVSVAASLSKLCALVCVGSERRTAALRRSVRVLSVCAHAQGAPPALRARAAHVRDPAALVQLFVECSEPLTEFEYKQALDLTELVDDLELREELRLKVWCASIVRDSWTRARGDADVDVDVDAARLSLRDKTFFRLLDLVQLMGGDLSVLLPPLEDLETSPALGELVADPGARYLLAYGYETLYAAADADPGPADTYTT